MSRPPLDGAARPRPRATARPRAAASPGGIRGPEPATPACEPRPDGSCSICGDEGLIGEVLEIPRERAARVRLPDGAEREVATDLLDRVRRGDRLVVHLGFAIARVRGDGPGDAAPRGADR